MPSVGQGVNAPAGSYGKNITAAPGSPNYYGAPRPYLNPGAFTVNNAGTNHDIMARRSVRYIGRQWSSPEYVPGTAARVGAGNVWSMGTYNFDFGIKRTFPI